MQKILNILYKGNNLNQEQSQKLMNNIIHKKLSDIQIATALISMKIRGETFLEIIGSIIELFKYTKYFPKPNCLFSDITGTGGDEKKTINISTASAIVASTCNIKIIKHGNYNISSFSGSMDLFAKNNIRLQQCNHANQARQKFDELGICFLPATQYHTIFDYIMPIRKQLNVPTLFNIIGPLINPSKPPLILIGVYKPSLLLPIAQTLQFFKYKRAAVVHCGGLDEIGLHAPTHIIELHNNTIHKYILTASDFGLISYPLQELSCSSKEEAYEYMLKLLKGIGKTAHKHVVAANVALLLKLFGHNNLKDNAQLALNQINNGIPYLQFLSLTKEIK